VGRLGSCCSWSSGFASGSVTRTKSSRKRSSRKRSSRKRNGRRDPTCSSWTLHLGYDLWTGVPPEVRMCRSPRLLGMGNHVLLGMGRFHNPQVTVRHRVQVQWTNPPPGFHQGYRGKTRILLLETPQEEVAFWYRPPFHRQLDQKPSHQLAASALHLSQCGWNKHGTRPLLLLSIHVPLRVQTMVPTQPQSKVSLMLMRMGVP